MSRPRGLRLFVTVAAVLLIAGLSIAHFGVGYEIAKIPAEQRATMTDFDWIGSGWIFAGMPLIATGSLILLGAWIFFLWITYRR